MQPAKDSLQTPAGTGGAVPKKSWGNAMVPFAPIMLAVVAACAAKQYGDRHPGIGMSMAHRGGVVDVNSKAPDFTLEDAHGGTLTLSQVTAKQPVVLVFYLGYNCPRCVRHLNELSTRVDEFKKYNARIVAVSPDTVAEERDSIQTYGDFKFPLLSDPQMAVARKYGLVYGEDTLFHGIYIIDTHGVVRFAMKSSHPYDNVDALLGCLQDMDREAP